MGPQNVKILGPWGPRILKFLGPGGPKMGWPYFHMTPVQDYKAGKLTIYSSTNFYPTSCLGRPFHL